MSVEMIFDGVGVREMTPDEVIALEAARGSLSAQPPLVSLDAMAEAYRDAVQAHMDARARSLGYDDIRNAVTYADEPAVPRFQEEGRAFRAWRSLVWEYCYALFDRIKAGQALVPTHEALFAGLPVLVLSVREIP